MYHWEPSDSNSSWNNPNQDLRNSDIYHPDMIPLLNGDNEAGEAVERDRTRLLNMGLTLSGSLTGDSQLIAGNVWMIQNPPHGISSQQTLYLSSTVQAPRGPQPQMIPTTPPPTTVPYFPHPTLPARPALQLRHPNHRPLLPPHYQHQPPYSRYPQPPAKGRPPLWFIAALITPVFIIIASISIGFAVWRPTLSANGSTNVVSGGTIQLQGNSFFPGSTITLTLDNTLPVYYDRSAAASEISQTMNNLASLGLHMDTLSSLNNTLTTRIDGNFFVTVPIDQNWSIGNHTISATESPSHRSAALAFTIYAPGTLPTSSPLGDSPSPPVSPTGTDSPSSVPSPSPTSSPTGTSAKPELSCVNPNSVTLGPLSEGYNLFASKMVTLCTSGSGQINWKASWNHSRAAWLSLDAASGQIQAPAQGQTYLNAYVSKLKPGNYTTTVTFTSQPGNKKLLLNVTLIIQAGCINASPNTLTFTGIAGRTDPPVQQVTVSNCGVVGTWSELIETNNSSSWLGLSLTGGTLQGGDTSTVTVSASNLKAKLPPGTYSGKILFAIGSSSTTVEVTLIVLPGTT